MVDAVTGAGLVAVEVAAGVGTAMYAGTAFGRRPETVRRSVVVILVLCALAMLGAGWAADAGAGISLAAFATAMWGALPKVGRRLVVSALAMVAFALVGAHWVLNPFAVFITIAAVRLLGHGGRGCSGASRSADRHEQTRRPVDLRKEPVAPAPVPSLAMYLFDERVPAQARDRIRSINERARAASQYLHQQGRGAALDAIEVERIRDDYAPGAVRGYLALPPWSAQGTVLSDGKTGAELLIDQLDLLEQRLRAIQESVALTGGTELLTHGRFLKDRFPEHGEDDLRI
ncbi:hypothetical protein [Allobranchiibius sp. CTAmp26]|uniref:hypothetical protein n=1 Tax=Allobranchiibius sp. CTAmp26 TaxID=2815214 RepID=UPI001AA0D315|nr:hypothetical protein [Allobranchiibius sp. CTAmp26]MBO1756279.1 hypothetical protein [Allobranchiibius sp. CTAmp26]